MRRIAAVTRRFKYWVAVAKIFVRGRRPIVLTLICLKCNFRWCVEARWNPKYVEYDWPENTSCPICSITKTKKSVDQ